MKRFSWHIVIALFFAVAGFWLILFQHPAAQHDYWYGGITILIAFTAFAMVTYTLWETQAWTARSLGILSYFCGDAILYWVLMSGQFTQFSMKPGRREGLTDAAASFFFVGSLLVLYGLYRTIKYEWTREDRTPRDMLFPPNWPLRLATVVLFLGGLVWGTAIQEHLSSLAIFVLATLILLFIGGILILERRTRPQEY